MQGVAPDPLTLLGLLADETRLRAYSALILGARSTADLARSAGLPAREAVRALGRLQAGGLVRRTGESWVPLVSVLREAVAAAAPQPAYVEHGVGDPEEAAVLRTFMPAGRLVQIPAPWAKRRIVLDHVCRVFEPGVRYAEREVDAMLHAFHPDHAALRRYLVDEGFLAREAGTYWRSGGTVDV